MSKIIKTVSYDQGEILNNIIELYCPGGFDVDVTYNIVAFYKNVPEPRLKYDIEPQANEVIKADCRNLPLKDSSVQSLVFDPPFLATNYVNSEPYKMLTKYGYFKNVRELKKFYRESFIEFERVIKKSGVLIMKCQDLATGRQQFFVHNDIYNLAMELGFYGLDLFILVATKRFIGHEKQSNARKFHSYFWVFRKARKAKLYKEKRSQQANGFI